MRITWKILYVFDYGLLEKWVMKQILNLNVILLPGYTEPLDDNIEVLVPDDDHGLYAIDILDPSWV